MDFPKVFVIFLCFSAIRAEESGIEQGRTFVHHAMKRLAFILPAIFFKLGVAFTLLILVTMVAVNNGFIGFMLLVVGLSSVLAKLQEARHHHHPSNVEHVPIVYQPGPSHHGWSHFLDRSDTSDASKNNAAATTHNYNSNYPYTDVVYTKYAS